MVQGTDAKRAKKKARAAKKNEKHEANKRYREAVRNGHRMAIETDIAGALALPAIAAKRSGVFAMNEAVEIAEDESQALLRGLAARDPDAIYRFAVVKSDEIQSKAQDEA